MPKFLAAEAANLQTGSSDALKEYAIASYVEKVQQDLRDLQTRGLTVTGIPTLDRLELQKVEFADGHIEIASYGCYDISGTQLVDATGADAIAPSTSRRAPVVVLASDSEGAFKIKETEPWSGENFC
ncbi:hypothetical protein [Pseudoclavibacter sp. RFBB5]|uniref:hypothetical protein n=1 Tax=Pseudoclavibacter sp. RFBB5 TaxID=2080574 RepID=UPI0015E22078|nr:hypothetical protein [Pseudoclavibacter sp. RFBB5]